MAANSQWRSVVCHVLVETRNFEGDYANDLIEMSLTGGGERTDQEHLALFEAVGLRVMSQSTVGWGYVRYELAV